VRPGVGWIIAGVVLCGGGLAVSIMSRHFVLYGAVIVGLIWIVRGIVRVVQSKQSPSPID
jgi:hypothetical protein